ncbi:hypothetical protein, partial [Pseudoalteromonas sp.]|uniref:hypothetical protein n=1 Tax=Pseudoalteromonas sp. TaxID=53249 RepID=UPI003001B269
NPARVITKSSESFDSLTSAVAFVTANPATIERLSTASYRSEAECLALSISYPDGGGADYVVEDNDGKGIDDGVWSAGAKQLKLNTSADCVIDSQFGVIGNNSNNASIGLQAALNYSVSDGKNLKTKMGGGVRRLVTGLVLNKGNWLEGTGTSHNTGTPSDSRGTLLRPSIGSNITVISTSLTSSDQPYTLKDFGISGSSSSRRLICF